MSLHQSVIRVVRAANAPAVSSIKEFPTSLEQQAGSKQTRPDELTSVSDSGNARS
ncbi:hypothetical protein MZC59_02960 [Yersinia pestis subsp. pestis]|uniref:hypothetical protein n=1 Tax=Yersinia pestis TaxID=632 RepID=UPI00240AB78D|nr:hypothetical protein [Yersinia pestis]MCV6853395.1 hypothetical protein [Yersinia pestis subsp. pestis]